MKPQRGAPPSDNRGNRLGRRARGSYDFIVLCLKRGVPIDRIEGFLLAMGLEPETVKRWCENAVKDCSMDPSRLRPNSVNPMSEEKSTSKSTRKRPSSSSSSGSNSVSGSDSPRAGLDRATGKFVLPEIEEATHNLVPQKPPEATESVSSPVGAPIESLKDVPPKPGAEAPKAVTPEPPKNEDQKDYELTHDVSLELVDATNRLAPRTRPAPPRPQAVLASSGSAVVGGVYTKEVKPELETQRLTLQQEAAAAAREPQVENSGYENRGKRKSSRRKGLRTQTRLMIFAASVALCWVVSDGGWAPGGVLRRSSIPVVDTTVPDSTAVTTPRFENAPIPIPSEATTQTPVETAVAPQMETLTPRVRKPATTRKTNRQPGRRVIKRRPQGNVRVPSPYR